MNTHDQDRYTQLANQEETPTGTPTGGTTLHGTDATHAAQKLVDAALNTGGRPRIDTAATTGQSPTVRARINGPTLELLNKIAAQEGAKNTSEALRKAVDYYVNAHT